MQKRHGKQLTYKQGLRDMTIRRIIHLTPSDVSEILPLKLTNIGKEKGVD